MIICDFRTRARVPPCGFISMLYLPCLVFPLGWMSRAVLFVAFELLCALEIQTIIPNGCV